MDGVFKMMDIYSCGCQKCCGNKNKCACVFDKLSVRLNKYNVKQKRNNIKITSITYAIYYSNLTADLNKVSVHLFNYCCVQLF